MLIKTRGIVFRFVKFGETSIIVNVFTEQFGLRAYMVNGVRSQGGKGRIALFQPLTLLDMVVYHRENVAIERIKEVKCLYPYHSLNVDIRKITLSMFLSEVLNKTVKEEVQVQALFDFLFHSFRVLDVMAEGIGEFHLIFLVRLSRLLGFGLHHSDELTGYKGIHPTWEAKLNALIQSDYAQGSQLEPNERRETLDLLLNFYARHIDTLGEIKSVPILKEVLH